MAADPDADLPADLLEGDDDALDPGLRVVELEAGGRLDRALADKLPELSRSRVQALLALGAVSLDEVTVTSPSARTQAGLYRVLIPAPVAAEPLPEAIPLTVLYEDQHLIVVDKPAGMATHPAPGSQSGTLVNALLRHCGDSLSGIGGVARPGIVHRLDKDTSGVMVAAKTDAAHQGLSALFAAHELERTYIALSRGAPSPPHGTIESWLGRSPHDRKKMAVLKSGGGPAITDYAVARPFGATSRASGARPLAAEVHCTLQTGRTHQIRVHLASKGAPVLGDAVYGSGPPAAAVREAIARAGLTRQALHAAVLGFRHPVTGEFLRFQTPPPEDMRRLQAALGEL